MNVVTLSCKICTNNFDHIVTRGRLPTRCLDCRSALKDPSVRKVVCIEDNCNNVFVIIGRGNKRRCDSCTETKSRTISTAVKHTGTCTSCGSKFEFIGAISKRKRCSPCIKKEQLNTLRMRKEKQLAREKSNRSEIEIISITCIACNDSFDYVVKRGKRPLRCNPCKESNTPVPKGYTLEDKRIIETLNLPTSTTAIALANQATLKEKANKRIDNLELMLKAIGAHISQHRESE